MNKYCLQSYHLIIVIKGKESNEYLIKKLFLII